MLRSPGTPAQKHRLGHSGGPCALLTLMSDFANDPAQVFNSGSSALGVTSSSTTVQLHRDGAVLFVELHRPEKLNALDGTILETIANIFTQVNSAFEVRAVVLSGAGRAFSAGADRKAAPGGDRMSVASGAGERERRYASQIGLRACAAIANCEVPTVAAVQGWCVGGGFALAVSCDFRIAATDAQFSIPEVDLGIPLAWGATPRLIGEIGMAKARELIMMCDPIDANEAFRIGVVNRVVPMGSAGGVAAQWAQRLAAKPEIAIHETKTQFRAYAMNTLAGNVTETDGDLMVAASRSPIAKAAFGAFAD
jgi:enoyl-CoA hydratase/carnithine racemase